MSGYPVRKIPDSPLTSYTPYDGARQKVETDRPFGIRQTSEVPAIPQNYRIEDGRAVERPPDKLDYAACGSATVAAELLRRGYFATVEGVDGHMRVLLGALGIGDGAGGSIWGANTYLRKHGLRVDQRFGGTWNELKAAVEGGFGVIVSFAHEDSNHTVIVTGMYSRTVTDSDGNQRIEELIEFQEWERSNLKAGAPKRYAMSRSVFERNWAHMRLGGLGGPRLGICNTYTLVGGVNDRFPPGGSLLVEAGAAISMATLDSFHQFLISFHYLREGEVLGGIARLLSGVIQGVVQLPAALPFALGTFIDWLADKALHRSGWAKFVFALPLLLARFAGTGLRLAGQIAGVPTAIIGRTLSRPLRHLADWARDDNDAVETLRYARADGTQREQENWARLCATPLEPGKVHLIERLLSGYVTDEERAMIRRVFAATAAKDRPRLRALIGGARLDKALGRQRATNPIASPPNHGHMLQQRAI